jgi:hypothetical protein
MFRFFTLFVVLILLFKASASFSQAADPFYQQIVGQVSYDTVLANLQQFESLGKKEAGTAALNNTADWLISKYQSYGYTNIQRDTFAYTGNQLYNIIVTKAGTVFPPRYLVIDGHYDTYHGPGTNDNGSGVAAILEIARLLSNIPTDETIKFIHFSAEEQGLIGSGHYVDHTVVPTNMAIKLVFNIDEVGGVAGMINNTITCERDESGPTSNNAASWAFTDTLVNLTHLYSNLQTEISYAYGSDYVPFQEAGEVITGFYETNESPYTHSANDLLVNMSPTFVTQVAKAATGAALYFAGGRQLATFILSEVVVDPFTVFPTPANRTIRWQLPSQTGSYSLRIFDVSGRQLIEQYYKADDVGILDISALKPGFWAAQFIFFDNKSKNAVVKFLKSK